MDIVIAAKLMELYAACPKCGCEVIGNGKGALECDTAAGTFRRTCSCGWSVEVREKTSEQAPRQTLQTIEDPPDESTAADVNEKPHVVIPESPPAPQASPDTHTPEAPMSEPWKGFVHIRCEACHEETTVCLRMPTTEYRCRACGHLTELSKPYRAYTRCECGCSARYLTNVTDWAFDIPCVACGAPNAVVYDPGKDCYTPADSAPRRTKARKKK